MPPSANLKVMVCIPVLLLGGTEIQTLATVRVLVAAGYTVTVCCYYEFDEGIVKLMEGAGATVMMLRLERSLRRYRLGDMLVLVRALGSIFRCYRPDIVHVQYLAPGLLPILAARLAGMRTVFATVHSAGNVVYGRKAKMLLRTAAVLCKAFFCVSKGVEEFWFGSAKVFESGTMGRRRHCTVYNGVDADGIASASATTDSTQLCRDLGIGGKHVLGIVGRLAEGKGHRVLLDAMVEVIRHFPDALLVIIGHGTEAAALQDKARQLGIEQHLRWMGARPHDEVLRIYKVLNVLVIPSLYEGFGFTAAEAMAAEKPVVGTRIEGLEEIVDHAVTGYLVSPGDSAELAAALIRVLSNPKEAAAMGMHGRMRVTEHFSSEMFAAAIVSAYRHFLKGKVFSGDTPDRSPHHP